MRAIGMSVGLVASVDAWVAVPVVEQMRKVVEHSLHDGAGRPSNAQCQLLGNVAMLVADSPEGEHVKDEARRSIVTDTYIYNHVLRA